MKLINNLVLIKPNLAHYEHITLSNGTVLWLDQRYLKEQHQCTSGTIVGVPDKLHYPKPYNPEMELQVGDEVIFNYLDYSEAKKDGKLDADGNMYLKYDFLYLAIRNDEVKMLNGWVVVEAAQIGLHSNKIILDNTIKPDETKGVVRYAGKPLDDGFEYPALPVGTTVRFAVHHSLPLQYQLHQIIDNDKVLYRIKYCDIVAVEETIVYYKPADESAYDGAETNSLHNDEVNFPHIEKRLNELDSTPQNVVRGNFVWEDGMPDWKSDENGKFYKSQA